MMSTSGELIRLQRVPCTGWEAKKDEIYQELKQYPKNKVTTHYLESDSESGESTGLFSDIVIKTLKELPEAKGIMIMRTEDEKRLMKKVLVQGKGQNEVFWGRLIETAVAVKQDTTQNCWMGLFLCASHNSDRTISAIREKLDPHLKVINYQATDDDDQDDIEWEHVPTKDWAFRVDWDFLENDNESRVVVLGGRHSQLKDLKIAMEKRYMYEIKSREAVRSTPDAQILCLWGDSARVLWVGEDVEWAMTLPKVECVFLDDCRETVRLDPSTGLPVRVMRKLTKTELLRKQSWLRRALWWSRDYQNREGATGITPFPLTKVISVSARDDILQRPDDHAKFDPAWNENIMLTVLANYCAWPGLEQHQMPCRKPPSLALWTNTRQLLRIAGVLTEDNKPTDLGVIVNKLASKYHWGWAEAYIVATLRLDLYEKGEARNQLEQEEYILALMAAIIGVEAECKEPLVTLQGNPEDWFGIFDDSCAGGAAALSDYGSLWVQAGVYRQKQNAKGKFAHDHIKVNQRSFKQIDFHLDFIPGALGGVNLLWPKRAYRTDTNIALDKHQQGYIDMILAKAFAGQMLFIKGQDLELATLSCVHVASGAPVRVPMEDDILYVGEALGEHKGMYMFSTRPLEPDGTRLRATGLTRMDRCILEDMAEEIDQTWPDVVKRALWPMTYYKYRSAGGISV
ncbi:hypothetical protein PG991_009625 [Apiospora marii]|uniref:Heterokaryon incompatibility domain-containing protein n=1 Tax=Apiospora marii TaxID=335849 RepID=A0ABR1RG40_9PEZI